MRILFLLLLLVSCQNQGPSDQARVSTKSAVINGEKVTEVENKDLFYSAVAIPVNGSFCSGVLISSNVVLTAAHCVYENGGPFFVYLGTTAYIGDGPTDNVYYVKKTIVHEDFKGPGSNQDLALLILEKKAKEPFRPIKIYDKNDYIQYGNPLYVAGFSLHSRPLKKDIFDSLNNLIEESYNWDNMEILNSESGTLYQVPMLMRNTILLEGPTKESDTLTFAQLSGGICAGDSGGPTMMKYGDDLFLVGINQSGGSKNEYYDCELVAYSTSTLLYKDWILNTVFEYGGDEPVFTHTNSSIDPKEVSCSNEILEAYSMYNNLHSGKPEVCQVIEGIDLKAALDAYDVECNQKCNGVKGFKGSCEFFKNGNEKILEHVQKACSNAN